MKPELDVYYQYEAEGGKPPDPNPNAGMNDFALVINDPEGPSAMKSDIDMNLGKPKRDDPRYGHGSASPDIDEVPDLTDGSDSEDDSDNMDHFENDKKTLATTTAANKKQNMWSKPEK